MSKPSVKDYEDKLELYEKLIATHPDIKRKGKTMPYTSHNGHMFSLFAKDGTLGIRLSKEGREEFLKKYNTSPFVQYGAVMRGYVTIPDELLENTEELKPYLDMSYEYIKTLKPKPTTKKKKK